MNGIDISQHQGLIDWDAVEGVDFVMIRAGYGRGNPDTQFRRNIASCNERGIPCGVYWFSYAWTEEMARREAEYCLEAVSPYQLSLPVAFDWEYDSCSYARRNGAEPTPALVSGMCRAFCETVRSRGYTPMNYTNPDYLSRFFDGTTLRYPLWLAQWASRMSWADPRADIWLWQYGTRSVKGISGPVDGNICYKTAPVASKKEDEEMSYEQFREYMRRYEAELAQEPPGDWSETERSWAQEKGLIRGDESGRFRWRRPLTREEFAVVAYREAHHG